MKQTQVQLLDWHGFDFDSCDSHIEDLAERTEQGEIIFQSDMDTTDLQTINDFLYSNVTYDKKMYAESVLNNFEYMLNDDLDLNEHLEVIIADVYSPKYYNYETDRITYNIDDSIMMSVRGIVLSRYKKELIAELKERFTPCDGFIPNYPNDFSEFLDCEHDSITNAIYMTVLIKQHIDYTNFNYNYLEADLPWYDIFEITAKYKYKD